MKISNIFTGDFWLTVLTNFIAVDEEIYVKETLTGKEIIDTIRLSVIQKCESAIEEYDKIDNAMLSPPT